MFNYAKFYREKKEQFNSQVDILLALKKYAEAFNIIEFMMEYGMWDRDDERVNKKALRKMIKDGYEPNTIMFEAYKANAGDLPKNLIADLPVLHQLMLTSKEHWSLRKELQYVGDILVPAKDYSYDIRVASNIHNARRMESEVAALYRKETGKTAKMGWIKALEAGKSKIYEIVLTNNQSFSLVKLGYFYISVEGDGEYKVFCLLNHTEMTKYYMSISQTYSSIKNYVAGYITSNNMGASNIQFTPMCDYKSASKKQSELYKKNPTLSMDSFVDKENKRILAEQENGNVQMFRGDR